MKAQVLHKYDPEMKEKVGSQDKKCQIQKLKRHQM